MISHRVVCSVVMDPIKQKEGVLHAIVKEVSSLYYANMILETEILLVTIK